MKTFVLTLLLLVSSAMFAQTTYDIIGGPYADGYYPPYLYSFTIQLSGDGNSIQWVAGSLNHEWACGNGKPSNGGFIHKTINGVVQPCTNATSYETEGTLTANGCTGPAMAVEIFDDGSTLTVYWAYFKGGKWHNTCMAEVVGGNLVQ